MASCILRARSPEEPSSAVSDMAEAMVHLGPQGLPDFLVALAKDGIMGP